MKDRALQASVLSRVDSQPSIRPMLGDDIPGVIALQKRAFPKMPPWTPRQLQQHLQHFPAGQLVAVDATGRIRLTSGSTVRSACGGLIVGSASSLLIAWDGADGHLPSALASWDAITGRGTFKTHDPFAGNTLYGADVGVDPACRGQRIGARLYEARRQLARAHGAKRIVAGGRIPGYAAVADVLSAECYVSEVVAGVRHDPVLSFQLAQGFRVRAVIPGYLPYDKPSCGYATLLEWLDG